MKRTIMSMLGAVAVAAGLSMFAAPAQAYTINCNPVTSTGSTNYPYNGKVQQCGNASNQAGNAAAGALADLGAGIAIDLYNKLSAQGTTFYVFRTAAEYQTYFSERGLAYLPPTRGMFGLTYYTSDVPQYSAVFQYDTDGQYIAYFGSVGNTTTHESGHWADYFYRSSVGSTSNYSSESKMFDDLLSRDWDIINGLTNCGTGGIFNGRKDFFARWMRIRMNLAGESHFKMAG